ncbi:GGDEF domain-containing protein [Undibacterium oligocarboniphilum]|uniref:diguanylate cyclase n=1 Tax=Undibacterium oligocarboniphilum TaxID=666702 RepID=A0A850QIS7_9BURK|nr:sensor domain-containing diguanylate cyclase [Undibacterium oligocarboniphilum]MBC3871053.1 sensor domain-containing diguanylate cyclase [Undibacterium oligocarboniphilum]NVO76324.1 sensor domain-containing diguanylate cyclase [Undibacterium oligocarboniphilum]
MRQTTAPHTASAADQAMAELRMENQLLRARLDDLLEQAHRNQNIMARHQSFDLKIIGASQFRELISCIFSSLAIMSELDIVTLHLIDPRQDLQQMLSDLRIDLNEFPHLHFIRHENELQTAGLPTQKPALGRYQPPLHQFLFQSCTHKPQSIAIIPLRRQNKLIGYLNIGSFSPERFLPTMATDFIERLGLIIAVCLENVINNERLTYIGLTDPLTNVSNRRYVEQRIREEIGRARRQRYGIACLYLDIDHFKQINDRYGHQGGDDVLCEVARRIKAELRLSDTLGRFGGEEFVVLLVNANLQDAMLVAERIRRSIANTAFTLSATGNCNTTISIGLTTVSERHNLGEATLVARDMLLRADRALYDAKRNGRNQVRCE